MPDNAAVSVPPATLEERSPDRLMSARAWFVALVVTAAMLAGYAFSESLGIDSNFGLGYWLGIAGTAAMILLLGYPLRKRKGPVIPGSVGLWFRAHMLLGLFGPLLILYHARFTWDAINSGVALWSMLLVAASGLIGRYIHVHIYSGFSLKHREASEIISKLRRQRDRLDEDGDLGQAVESRLDAYRRIATHPRRRLLRAIYSSLRLSTSIARHKPGLMKAAAGEVARHLDERGAPPAAKKAAVAAVRQHIADYLAALQELGNLSTFERLFALWHLAHIPLYIFLGVAAVIHILAVHYY